MEHVTRAENTTSYIMKVWGRSSDASCEKFYMKNAARGNKETTLMNEEASRQKTELCEKPLTVMLKGGGGGLPWR